MQVMSLHKGTAESLSFTKVVKSRDHGGQDLLSCRKFATFFRTKKAMMQLPKVWQGECPLAKCDCCQALWCLRFSLIIDGSLEVKLPTTWTDEKQRWEESERR